MTVLDRRFAALRWERELLGYAAVPEQLAAMRLHALMVNPALTGLDYIERVGIVLLQGSSLSSSTRAGSRPPGSRLAN